MESKNLVTFLELNGVEKTLETLIGISKEMRHFITDNGYDVDLSGKFEIDLFCMSYYLFYLSNRNSSEIKSLTQAVADFYSSLPECILDPIQKRMFRMLITDKDLYIKNKITQYQHEIIEYGQNKNFLPKYIFSSFLMYPTMTVDSIQDVSGNISDTVAKKFYVIISGLVEFLDNTCEKIIEYVDANHS